MDQILKLPAASSGECARCCGSILDDVVDVSNTIVYIIVFFNSDNVAYDKIVYDFIGKEPYPYEHRCVRREALLIRWV